MSSYLSIAAATLLPQCGNLLFSSFSDYENKIWSKDGKVSWYDGLKKAPWTPPNWAFPPVWLGLYSSIGYASYLVWKEAGGFNEKSALPLAMYGANLMSNWVWSPIFFDKNLIELGFYNICFTLGSGVAVGKLFYDVNPTAGYLIAPYVAWLTLATSLIYYIWRNNPEQKSK